MRNFHVALSAAALSVVVLACAFDGGGATAAPAHQTAAATAVTVVRPVTSAGKPVAGFTVQSQHDKIYCNYPSASPGAVDPDIDYCSPDAAGAFACWDASKAGHAYCLQDLKRHKLVEFSLSGKFAKATAPKPKKLAPLLLRLKDGNSCSLLTDGTGGLRKQNPHYTTSYFCSKKDTAVWTPPKASHAGVNETKAIWTVKVGKADGKGKLKTRPVAKAYFVGTAS